MKPEHAEEYTDALGQIVAGAVRLADVGVALGIPHALGMTSDEWLQRRLAGPVMLDRKERRQVVAANPDVPNRELGRELGVDEGTIRNDRKELAAEDSAPIAENSAPPVSPGAPDPRELGVWRSVVLDPPWPIEKIEREVRPNQGRHLDYPVMSLDEIGALPIPELVEPDGAHVYLWTTHRFLPAAFRLLERWGCRYECVLTWRKNVGPTPFSWMYDTEHVLFARAGAGLALERNGLRLSFTAPATGHSRKPDVFYERVRQVSPEPRLDMFARESRDGFTPWGDEVAA